MADTYELDGWSPRTHHIKQLDEKWGIGDDSTLECVMTTLDVLEEMIDDLQEFRRRKIAPVTELRPL